MINVLSTDEKTAQMKRTNEDGKKIRKVQHLTLNA